MAQTRGEREVEPNARYDAVFGTNYEVEDEAEREEIVEEVRAERAVLDEAEAEVERYATDPEPYPPEGPALTWEIVSVTEDPQILASICSYFTGVDAGEDVEEIRRKLRTADAVWYVNTFIVARGILDSDDGDGDGGDGGRSE